MCFPCKAGTIPDGRSIRSPKVARKPKEGPTETAGQKAQYPLITECTLNHIKDPTIVEGIFANLRICGYLAFRMLFDKGSHISCHVCLEEGSFGHLCGASLIQPQMPDIIHRVSYHYLGSGGVDFCFKKMSTLSNGKLIWA